MPGRRPFGGWAYVHAFWALWALVVAAADGWLIAEHLTGGPAYWGLPVNLAVTVWNLRLCAREMRKRAGLDPLSPAQRAAQQRRQTVRANRRAARARRMEDW